MTSSSIPTNTLQMPSLSRVENLENMPCLMYRYHKIKMQYRNNSLQSQFNENHNRKYVVPFSKDITF